MKNLKNRFLQACSSTFMVIIFTIILSINKKKDSDFKEIIIFVCILTLLGVAIAQWTKYWKTYIDKQIDEKLKNFKTDL